MYSTKVRLFHLDVICGNELNKHLKTLTELNKLHI